MVRHSIEASVSLAQSENESLAWCWLLLFCRFLSLFLLNRYVCLYSNVVKMLCNEDGHSHFETRVTMYGMHLPCLRTYFIENILQNPYTISTKSFEIMFCSAFRQRQRQRRQQQQQPQHSSATQSEKTNSVNGIQCVEAVRFWDCVRLACICSFCHLCVIFEKRLFSLTASPLHAPLHNICLCSAHATK